MAKSMMMMMMIETKSRGLIWALSRHMPRETEEFLERLLDIRYPDRDSNRARLEACRLSQLSLISFLQVFRLKYASYMSHPH